MSTVCARLVEWDEQPLPGWAHVVLPLADGREVDVWDKMPVLGVESGVQVGDTMPLDCEVVEDGPDVMTVRLRHGVAAVDEGDTFVVRRTQVV